MGQNYKLNCIEHQVIQVAQKHFESICLRYTTLIPQHNKAKDHQTFQIKK